MTAAMVTFGALRERFLADTQLGGGGAAPALARALERIGWRAVGEPTADELASHVVYLVDACVHDHHDVDALLMGLAALLRDAGPLLDGGLPPAEAYLPAAEAVIDDYVAPSPRLEPFLD